MKDILGKRVVELRTLTVDELSAQGWEDEIVPVVAIVLENGLKLYPSSDMEGKSGGALFFTDGSGGTYRLMMEPDTSINVDELDE
tara:strand:+ start:1073 stop:1327 length:255 start_codon:yes stop_codon:yes gene_type:complete